MPYVIQQNADGKWCVYHKGADGAPVGDPLADFDTQELAQQCLVGMGSQDNAGRIRVAGEGKLEVLGVPYKGLFNGRDSYGTYWNDDSRLWLDEPHDLPVIYGHGLPEKDKSEVECIGIASPGRRDREGQWFNVALDLSKQGARKVWNAVQEGFASASSGALDYLTEIDEQSGRVLQWILGELSLFDNREIEPGNRLAIVRPALRNLYQRAGLDWPFPDSLTSSEGANQSTESAATTGDATNNRTQLRQSEDNTMDPNALMALLQQIAQMINDALSASGGEAPPAEAMQGAMEALRSEATKIVDGLKESLAGLSATEADKAVRAALDSQLEPLANVYLTAAQDAQKIAAQKIAATVATFRATTPGVAHADRAGGVTNGGKGRVTGGEDLRYAHLTAAEMAVGIALRTAPLQAAGVPYTLDQVFSEDYLRNAAGKVADWVESMPKNTDSYRAMRAAVPWRAGELDASDVSSQGSNWVQTALGTTLWEKARKVRIYRQFMERGMMEEEMPAGATAVDLPLEGNDPIAYSSPQAHDADATNRPEVTAKINSFATGNTTLTPGEIKIATAYTVVFEESSIIRLAPQVTRQLEEKAEETVEQLILNGDTVTTASTNLNLIDATPGTGISRPYYLASNGMLKFPIITSTGYSRSAQGSLDIKDYLNTRKLLPKEVRDRLDRLMFVADSDTNQATLALPELTTQDVNRYATIESGEIVKLWGVPYFVSGFIELANNAGKVPNAGGTLGRILCVYPPYWKFAFARGVTIETDRDILSGTNIYVASFRLGIAARGAGAASASFNVGVTVS